MTFYSAPEQDFDLSQLSLLKFTPESFAAGALTALFFFWGWDVTVNLSEETENSTINPGRGAVVAMFFVLLLFISFMIAAQFAMSKTEIINADSNLTMAISEKILPGKMSYIAIIAVLLSTVGTLETTILQFTRTLYAKGRAGILNPKYAQLHKTWNTPWYATLTIAGIGLVLLGTFAFLPTVDQIIALSVKAIGFQVAFYYGITCFACAWKFRYLTVKEIKDFVLLFLWPLISGFFMTFIFLYCAISFDWLTISLGIGGIIVGTIPLYLNRRCNSSDTSFNA